MPFRRGISIIGRPGNGLGGPENEESPEKSELSNVVPHVRELSNQEVEDLKDIYLLKKLILNHL